MVYKRKRSSSDFKSRKFRRAAYTRPRRTNRMLGAKRISKIARQVVLSTAESKDKLFGEAKAEVYHNSLHPTLHINNPTANCMPALGSQDNMRVGDRIIARGFRLRMLFGQKADRPNVTWRVIIVAQRAGTGAQPYNQLFRTNTNNGLLDDINTDRFTVLKQAYMKPQQASYNIVSGGFDLSREYTFMRKFWIPRKKIYKFEQDGSYQHNDRDIWVYVVPYDAFGSLVTDNIGYVQCWSNFLYKDP